jgi:hypothetical protein
VRSLLIGLLAAAVAAGGAPAANAGPVAIGATARPGTASGQDAGCGYVQALYVPGLDGRPNNNGAPSGDPAYTVPAGGGVITSWSTSSQYAGTPLRLAITRFTDMGVVVQARSAPETITQRDAVNTFATNLRVRGGEQIALDIPDVPHEATIPHICYYAGAAEEFAWITGDEQADGTTQPFTPGYGQPHSRVNIAATLDDSPAAQAPPPPSTQPSAPGDDTIPPAIAKLRLSTTVRRGTRAFVEYELSEPARVTIRLRRLRHRHGATAVAGSLEQNGAAGPNRLRFGWRRLTPGRYRLVFQATDGAGNRSSPATLALRVRR